MFPDDLIEKWERERDAKEDKHKHIYDKFISDLKYAQAAESFKYDPVSLDSKCRFKKHAGKLWKEVIQSDPGYVSWCLEKMQGFSLDQTAHQYLIEIEGQ